MLFLKLQLESKDKESNILWFAKKYQVETMLHSDENVQVSDTTKAS